MTMTARDILTADQARVILLSEYREKAGVLTAMRDELTAQIKSVNRRDRNRPAVKAAKHAVRKLGRTIEWLNNQAADLAAEIKTR